jgi:hypothetical protein
MTSNANWANCTDCLKITSGYGVTLYPKDNFKFRSESMKGGVFLGVGANEMEIWMTNGESGLDDLEKKNIMFCLDFALMKHKENG